MRSKPYITNLRALINSSELVTEICQSRLDQYENPNRTTWIPTNNASEWALRYVVVFCKISGQIKGGQRVMTKMSHFATCVPMLRVHGKSITEGSQTAMIREVQLSEMYFDLGQI